MPNPTPASIRAHAEAAEIVRRLLRTRVPARQLAAEYGCRVDTIYRVYRRHTTRRQREAARRRKLRLTKKENPSGFIGRTPWNKGLSVRLSPRTEFKTGCMRGTAAKAYRPVGTITVRNDPRSGKPSRWIKASDTGPVAGRWELYARWWWERNVGPVPPGHRVMHRNGDTLDDAPVNLVCLSGADALRLMDALDPSRRQRQCVGWVAARRKRAAAERERADILRVRMAELLKRSGELGLRDADLARSAGLTQNRLSQLRHGRARMSDAEWRSITAALSQAAADVAGEGSGPLRLDTSGEVGPDATAAPRATDDRPRTAKEAARQRVAAFLSQLERGVAA